MNFKYFTVAAMLLVLTSVATPQTKSQIEDPWKPFKVFLGKWNAENPLLKDQKIWMKTTFYFDLDKHVLIGKMQSAWRPKTTDKVQIAYSQMLIISRGAEGKFHAIQFDTYDRTFRYDVTLDQNKQTIVLVSALSEPYPKWRLQYTMPTKNELVFEEWASEFGSDNFSPRNKMLTLQYAREVPHPKKKLKKVNRS